MSELFPTEESPMKIALKTLSGFFSTGAILLEVGKGVVHKLRGTHFLVILTISPFCEQIYNE